MIFTNDTVWEFFSPFAHIPGKYEFCRIHSPTHGSFDTFIVLGETTSLPPVVYVNSNAGVNFMEDRYPESACIRVGGEELSIFAENGGTAVEGILTAREGPVHSARLSFSADPGTVPRAVPYGGPDFAVWGGRWACEGIDLVREGTCTGELLHEDGRVEKIRAVPCIVTAGSIAGITPFGDRRRTR